MSGHARLSASSAHRWMHCSGSVKLSEGLPNPSSIHAATGTFAHGIASDCLDLDKRTCRDMLGFSKNVEGFDITCTEEMVEAIDVYLNYIYDDRKPGDTSATEVPLWEHLSKVDPDLGGTADRVRYRPSTKHLRSIDFKYGSGTYVKAGNNPQLKIYALGAMLMVNRPVETVELVVVQPRFEKASKIRTWEFKASEIIDFIADLKDAAVLTRDPRAELILKTGNWCKFCAAADTCPQREVEGKRKPKISINDFDAVTDGIADQKEVLPPSIS